MKKIMAIQSYLISQYRYDVQLGWLINGLICIFFLLVPLFIGNDIIFGLTPSVAVYVIITVHGMGWIRRTLGYLLKLGVNRQAYSIGTIVFSFLFSFINAALITLVCFIHQLIKTNVTGYKLMFFHPAALFSNEHSLLSIFLFDFLLCNTIFLIAIIISITYHRIGKLGGNLTLTVISIIILLNLFTNGFVSLFNWVADAHIIITIGLAFLFIVVFSLSIVLATRNTSINKCNI